MDIVNEFFHKHYPADLSPENFEYTPILGGRMSYAGKAQSRFPRIECADGFSMSVQGGYGIYSSPRDDFADKYSEVEVGYPSEREELLMEYAEESACPTDTVYGYVPIAVVVAVVEKHGGLKK